MSCSPGSWPPKVARKGRVESYTVMLSIGSGKYIGLLYVGFTFFKISPPIRMNDEHGHGLIAFTPTLANHLVYMVIPEAVADHHQTSRRFREVLEKFFGVPGEDGVPLHCGRLVAAHYQ
jgi:hypothetical protein